MNDVSGTILSSRAGFYQTAKCNARTPSRPQRTMYQGCRHRGAWCFRSAFGRPRRLSLALSIAGGTNGSTTAEATIVEVMADCARETGRYAWAEKCRIAEVARVVDIVALVLLSRCFSSCMLCRRSSAVVVPPMSLIYGQLTMCEAVGIKSK